MDLKAGGTRLPPGHKPWQWLGAPKQPLLTTRGSPCGERIALSPGPQLVVAQAERPGLQVNLPGALLFVDPVTGAVRRSVTTLSEPSDVLTSLSGA